MKDQKNMVKVALFSESNDHLEKLRKVASIDEMQISIQACPIKTTVEDILLRYVPDVIIMDFGSFAPDQLEHILMKLEKISEAIPVVGILAAEQQNEILTYVNKGVRAFLNTPLREDEIKTVLQRFYRESKPAFLQRTGKVYTFMSYKGGIGNTFLTINTAAALAKMTKKKVLLWDMSLQAGDIPFFLNVQPQYSVVDLVRNLQIMDHTYLEGVLKPLENGLFLLPVPLQVEEVESLNPLDLERLLNILTECFDYVVIDGGYHLTDQLLPLADAASNFFVTTTLELISLRGASRCIEILDRLRYPADKIKIIVNRYNSKYESVHLNKAREILKYEMAHFFPNDYATVSRVVNLGQTIFEGAEDSALSHELQSFAKKIVNNFVEPKKNQNFFQLLNQNLHKAGRHVA